MLIEKDVAAAPARSAAAPSRKIVRNGTVLGFLLFLIQNLSVWAAWLHSASGTQSLGYIQAPDVNQYLSFLALARNHTLFSDLHAPWLTEPAMLNPIFLISGKLGAALGASPIATFHALSLVMYLIAGVAFLWTLHQFCETRAQRVAATIAGLCAAPLLLFATGALHLVLQSAAPLFLVSGIELSYMTSDGLFRGGLSNSPTLTFGTACVLLGLGFTAKRLTTNESRWTFALAATIFLSALLHPFEVFVIAPSAIASLLLLQRAWKDSAIIAAAAGLGLAPYVWQSVHHPWFRELSQTFTFEGSFGRILMGYGIAFLAVPYLLLMGARPRKAADRALLIAWALTLVISLSPGAPFPPHLLDGFAPLTGLLVVRLAAEPKFDALYQAHRRPLQVAAALLLALNAIAYGALYTQIARDAGNPQQAVLLTSAAAEDEIRTVDRLRQQASEDDLALAPAPLNMMLITVPMHSFNSHDHLSFSHHIQEDQSAKFFEGKLTDSEAQELLSAYGFRWLVVPDSSPALRYLQQDAVAFREGRFLVYRRPQGHLKPYPGLANILPLEERYVPLSERVLRLLER